MTHAYRWSLAVGVLLLFSGATHAQTEKAFSVPVSQKIVRFEAQAPDGHWIKGAVLEGDQFRIEDHFLGQAVALVPVAKDDGVLFRIFRIEKHGADGESMHFVEELEMRPEETAFTKKAPSSLSIRGVSIGEPKATRGLPTAKSACRGNASQVVKNNFTGRCCVTCGGTTSCGCAVDDTCGSCCSGICCVY